MKTITRFVVALLLLGSGCRPRSERVVAEANAEQWSTRDAAPPAERAAAGSHWPPPRLSPARFEPVDGIKVGDAKVSPLAKGYLLARPDAFRVVTTPFAVARFFVTKTGAVVLEPRQSPTLAGLAPYRLPLWIAERAGDPPHETPLRWLSGHVAYEMALKDGAQSSVRLVDLDDGAEVTFRRSRQNLNDADFPIAASHRGSMWSYRAGQPSPLRGRTDTCWTREGDQGWLRKPIGGLVPGCGTPAEPEPEFELPTAPEDALVSSVGRDEQGRRRDARMLDSDTFVGVEDERLVRLTRKGGAFTKDVLDGDFRCSSFLHPTLPVFECTGVRDTADRLAVVSVGKFGPARVERTHPWRLSTAVDGWLVVEEESQFTNHVMVIREMARSPDGSWRSFSHRAKEEFSLDVSGELRRPRTVVDPTGNPLYLACNRSRELIVYDQSYSVRWRGPSCEDADDSHMTATWSGTKLRIWPLNRSGQSCSLTLDMSAGSAGAGGGLECREGELHAAPPFALLETENQILETVDSGRTWTPVKLPTGTPEPARIECSNLGCRIGPYARIGWGSSTE